MKTWNELHIGDTIHFIDRGKSFLDHKDQYGNVRKNNIMKSFIVTDMRRNEDEDATLINRVDNKYASLPYMLKIPDQYLNESRICIEKNKEFFFCDKTQYNKIIREKVVNKIQEEMQSIEDYKKTQLNKVKSLRKKYYEILN